MNPITPVTQAQFAQTPLAIRHPPSTLQKLAENFFKGARCKKVSDLIPLVNYARRLGIDESLLPRIGYTLWRASDYLPPAEFKLHFGTATDEISERLKTIFELADRQKIKVEYRILYNFCAKLPPNQVRPFLQIIDKISLGYPSEDQKALVYLWYLFPAPHGPYQPACVVEILNKIKGFYPNCTYQTQIEISTRILEAASGYYNNSDFDAWAWNAFLEASVQQKQIDLHLIYLLLEDFFHKLYPPLSLEQQHLVLDLFRRPILPNEENWNHRFRYLQLVNVHMKRFFDPKLFENLTRVTRLNFLVFLIGYWEKYKSTITYNEISTLQMTLQVFFDAAHCDRESILLFQTLEHLFKIDVTSHDFHYNPLVNHGLGNNQEAIHQYECGLNQIRANWDHRTHANYHRWNPWTKKNKTEITHDEYRVVCALFNNSKRVHSQYHPIELTLQTISPLYECCEDSIRSLIRYKAIRFYLDFIPAHSLSDPWLGELAQKIIIYFDFHVDQETETIRLVIENMSKSQKLFHGGYYFSVKIRGLISLWNLMAARDNSQQSIVPLLMQASQNETCVLNSIFAFLVPAAEIAPSEVVFDLIINRMKSEELTILHRMELCTLFLNAPCFSAAMRQAVIDHVLENAEKTIYLDTVYLNFLKALTKRCENDVALRLGVCDRLHEDFMQDFVVNTDRKYFGSKHFEPWTLEFIGILPSAVTVDQFVNIVFQSLPSINQYQLRCHIMNTVVIQHLYELRMRIDYFCMDELLGYYHFFKPIYEKVFEEAGQHAGVQEQWKGFTTSLANWHRGIPKLKEYQKPEWVNKIL